jgi:type II secretory pathway pseudopilin PulG
MISIMHRCRTFHEGRCRAGFTVAELLVALTLSAVVLVGVLGVVSAETKRLSVEREVSDTRYTLRAAATLIGWDLRQAAVGQASLDQLTSTSFIVRSPTAVGVVCNKAASGYTLTDVTGVFTGAATDSVQVLFAAGTRQGEQRGTSWEYFRVQQAGPPGTVGLSYCNVLSQPATVGVRLEVPLVDRPILGPLGEVLGTEQVLKDTTGILVGVPFLEYRRTLYGITTAPDGKRWFGRLVGDSPTWELLTGPLQEDGLQFSYYAADGLETAVPEDVVAVRITLRAESAGRTLGYEKMQDSLTVRVNLRN